MEPKRIKKMTLKKETISNLSNFEQRRIIGGEGSATVGYGECDCYYKTEQLACHTGYGMCKITATSLCYVGYY